MDFEKCFKLLNPESNKRVIVATAEPVSVALYLAGKAKEQGKVVEATALTANLEEDKSIRDKVYEIEEKHPELKEVIEKGLPKTVFEKTSFENFQTKLKYDYLVFEQNKIEKKHFEKIISLGIKKAVVSLPLSYFMPMEAYETKFFLIKKRAMKSLKQLLEEAGAHISYYDAEGQSLIVVFESIEKALEFKQAGLEKASEEIVKELEKYLKYVKENAEFAVKSEDGEYLYYIKTMQGEKGFFEYELIYFNGMHKISVKDKKTKGKKYEIAVLPNTRVFQKELEKKEVIITTKTEAVKLFQETYSPY